MKREGKTPDMLILPVWGDSRDWPGSWWLPMVEDPENARLLAILPEKWEMEAAAARKRFHRAAKPSRPLYMAHVEGRAVCALVSGGYRLAPPPERLNELRASLGRGAAPWYASQPILLTPERVVALVEACGKVGKDVVIELVSG